ncbi:ornithine cyclodeaminase family protein [Aerococcaceae bacterium DSM 111020]|nr:ornithine cyclodeaminase family protein [Aerococcaceae bacterium DSM 111020]
MKASQDTILINQSTIKKYVNMDTAIDLVRKAYQGMGDETTKNPRKVNLDLGELDAYPDHDGFLNAMPAYIGSDTIAGLKWVGGIAGKRREAGLPFIFGMILLADPEVGGFKAVLDGQYITNIRTGAQTAVAIDYLFEKPSISIGMFGTGQQAHQNLDAISRVIDIHELVIWNHRTESAERFKEDAQSLVKGDIRIVSPDRPQDACNVDAIITVTLAKEPIIDSEMLKPGTVIFPMGSYQEITDSAILRADRIIVDHKDQALHRGALTHLQSEGKISEDDIQQTLPEIAIHGLNQPIEEDIILCIPIGVGATDVVIASYVYEQVIQNNDIDGHFNFEA